MPEFKSVVSSTVERLLYVDDLLDRVPDIESGMVLVDGL